MTDTARREPTEAELAGMSIEELEAYSAGFTEQQTFEPPAPRRLDVSISVRFSSEEMELLRLRAEEEGVKVTAFIRALALAGHGGEFVDRPRLRALAAVVVRDLLELERQLG